MSLIQFLFSIVGLLVLVLVGLSALGHPVMAPVGLYSGSTLTSSGSSPDTVYQSTPLKSGSSITSLTGGFVLANNVDGTLTITNTAKTVLWSTGTADKKAKTLSVNPIGQAVFSYDDASTPAVALNLGVTAEAAYFLKLGADGTLAVFDAKASTVLNTIFTPPAAVVPVPTSTPTPATPGVAPVAVGSA